MKVLGLILMSQFAIASAMAADASTVVLSRVARSGTVAPQFQSSDTCTVSGGLVRIEHKDAQTQFPRPLLKQASFTTDVPNMQVADSLAGDAARAPVQHRPGPIGGSTVTYDLTIGGAEAMLAQTSGGSQTSLNNSEAAKKLVKFLDQNCK